MKIRFEELIKHYKFKVCQFVYRDGTSGEMILVEDSGGKLWNPSVMPYDCSGYPVGIEDIFLDEFVVNKFLQNHKRIETCSINDLV